MTSITRSILAASVAAVAVGVTLSVGQVNQASGRPSDVKPKVDPQTAPKRVAQVDARVWNVAKGPDPFALPHQPSPPNSERSVPVRKTLAVDSPFIGRLNHDVVIVDWHRPPLPVEAVDPTVRMSGFLSGNGVYAVLETPQGTEVVNPGDDVGDRIVHDIRPTETRLTSGSTTYTVSLRQ